METNIQIKFIPV